MDKFRNGGVVENVVSGKRVALYPVDLRPSDGVYCPSTRDRLRRVFEDNLAERLVVEVPAVVVVSLADEGELVVVNGHHRVEAALFCSKPVAGVILATQRDVDAAFEDAEIWRQMDEARIDLDFGPIEEEVRGRRERVKARGIRNFDDYRMAARNMDYENFLGNFVS